MIVMFVVLSYALVSCMSDGGKSDTTVTKTVTVPRENTAGEEPLTTTNTDTNDKPTPAFSVGAKPPRQKHEDQVKACHSEEFPITLSSVTLVDGVAASPDGTKQLVFKFTGDPSVGTVTFGAIGDGVVRTVKFIDGEQVNNSYFDLNGDAYNHQVQFPVLEDVDSLTVTIPAVVGDRFFDTWTASLEVEGYTVSTCE